MKRVYLDNSATSYPKAPGVGDAIANYINENGASVNRGAYSSAYEIENTVFETRELLAQLFNYNVPENVIFTKNITESMNLILKGLLNPGDEVVVSSMEHNAVMRPLNKLKDKRNIVIRVAKCGLDGDLKLETLKKQLTLKTKLVVVTHASNVSGTILDLEGIGEICKAKGIYFIVDAAQTAGVLDIDMGKIKANAIAFTGHKGLLGPQGIGGLIVDKNLVTELDTFIEGGTGSLSEQEIQPEYMPDKFESGTPNVPGIIGLNVALKYINEKGIENIHNTEMELVQLFLTEMLKLNNIRVIGKKDIQNRVAVCSIDFKELDNGEVSYILDKKYGISTRCGLHCAPSAHKTMDTFPNGTVRFSFGQFNTVEDVKWTVNAIKEICL